MGSKTTVKTQEQQKNEPPSWAQPGLSELGRRITAIIPQVPGSKYTGDFIAQPSQAEQQIPGLYGDLADFMRSTTPAAMEAMNKAWTPANFAGPGVRSFSEYDPTAIQPVVQAATAPIMRQLTEQVLPGLQSSGIESGAYGGSRSTSTLPTMALAESAERMGEIGTRLAFEDFQAEEARRLQSFGLGTERGLGEAATLSQRLAMFPDLLDTVLRTQAGAADTDAQAAAYDRMLEQMEIDNQLAKFDYGIRQPFQGLDVAAALLGNLAQPWGTRSISGTQTQSQGGLGQLLQAGLGLGGMFVGAGGLPGISGLFKTGG